jgi:hypothetical protein
LGGNVDPGTTADATGKLFASLKDAPLWLLTAVALSLGVFVYFAPFASLVSPATLTLIRYAAVVATILAGCRAVSLLSGKLATGLSRRPPPFHLTAMAQQSMWGTARQPDGTVTTQISVRATVKNMSDAPLALMSARLVKPRMSGEVLNNLVFVRSVDSDVYGTAHVSQHDVPPHCLLPVHVELVIRGSPRRRQTGNMRAVIGISDDEGREQRLTVELRCFNAVES